MFYVQISITENEVFNSLKLTNLVNNNTTVLSPAGVLNQFPFPLSLPVLFLLLLSCHIQHFKRQKSNKKEQYFWFPFAKRKYFNVFLL